MIVYALLLVAIVLLLGIVVYAVVEYRRLDDPDR